MLFYLFNHQLLIELYNERKRYATSSKDNYNNNDCTIFTRIENEKFVVDEVSYPNILPNYHNKTINLKCLNLKSIETKKILLWTKFKGLPLLPLSFGVKKPFEELGCPVTNCELIYDKSRVQESSLVLFHLRNQIQHFPKQRSFNQRWIHIIYESPINCHLCDAHENTFNLSATYTKESDFSSIYWTDSGLYWSLNKQNENIDAFSNKTEFAATLISSCDVPSSRSEYIKELQNHVSIRLYGKCGQPCPANEDCREHISRIYKFFLVFENSVCRDYITEKFFDTLRYNIIPSNLNELFVSLIEYLG